MKEIQLPMALTAEPLPKPTFDYSQMDAPLAETARALVRQAGTMHAKWTRDILELGSELNRIKSQLAHGVFMKWVEAEFPFGHKSATNYMRAAAVFGDKVETVSNLPPTVVYRLASPATPEPLRNAIVEELAAGKAIPPEAIAEQVADARRQIKIDRAIERRGGRRRAAPLSAEAIKRREKSEEKRQKEVEREMAEREERFKAVASLFVEVAGERAAEVLNALRGVNIWEVMKYIEPQTSGACAND